MKKYIYLWASIFYLAAAHAEEAVPTSGSCAGNSDSTCAWSFDASTGTLSITGSGSMKKYNADTNYTTDAPWFAYKDNISNINIENGISNIGNAAFAYTNVSNVHIPNSVETIGYGAFKRCTQLTDITLPQNLKVIEDDAFVYSALTSLDVPASVESIGHFAFATNNMKELSLNMDADLKYGLLWEGGTCYPKNSVKIYCKGNIDTCKEKMSSMGIPNKDIPFSYGIKVYRTNKRIYTVEEANADSKKNGNTIKIRYR